MQIMHVDSIKRFKMTGTLCPGAMFSKTCDVFNTTVKHTPFERSNSRSPRDLINICMLVVLFLLVFVFILNLFSLKNYKQMSNMKKKISIKTWNLVEKRIVQKKYLQISEPVSFVKQKVSKPELGVLKHHKKVLK